MSEAIKRTMPDYYFSKVVDEVSNESLPHYHQALEIYFMKKGECNYLIGNRFYRVKPGDIILIPEGIIHSTNYGGMAHTRIVLNCSEEYIPSFVYSRLLTMDSLYRNGSLKKKFDFLFSQIEEEYMHADQISNEMLKCYTSEILLLMLRNKNEADTRKESSTLIPQTLKYIQHNYMNDVKLSSVAKQLSVSVEHLSRSFKKETGMGFSEYLTLYRLQKAEFMLRSCPNKPISEVAYNCGFNDANYFSYKFKEAYGFSPIKIKGKKAENAQQRTWGPGYGLEEKA